MLLLHHDHHEMELVETRSRESSLPKLGASGRTRTDEYEFTKLVLWLLRHRGKMASTAELHLRRLRIAP